MQDGATLTEVQDDVRPIRRLGAGALAGERGGHRVRQTEQQQRLIHQVRPQIKPDPRALSRLFAPAGTHLGPVPVEMRLHMHRIARGAARKHGLHGKEIAVPATILKDGQQPPSLSRHAGQMPRLHQCGREGLVNDHVLARA